ncbi:hypothetical protein TNCV_107531 [Trichonephila clavipes]|nr:hypothetical protein TNCV_107531 [Trichonephila clavipes]
MLSRIINGDVTMISHITPVKPNIRWIGETHTLQSRPKSNKRYQSTRLCPQCSGTSAMFCLWTLCHKKQLSTQVPTAQATKAQKSIVKQTVWHAYCQKTFCSSTIMQRVTFLE